MAATQSNTSTKNVCLILLIGLPGSGKTYLTNFLVDHFSSLACGGGGGEQSYFFNHLSVVPVTYDNYVNYVDHWKQNRRIVLDSVQEIVCRFKCYQTRQSNITDTIVSSNLFNSCQCKAEKNLFIIIDDNMYYRSMRFEYFKLAKTYKTGFCQIYLETTLQEALLKNRLRVNAVPQEVITRMHDKMQEPNPLDNNWEQKTLVINAHDDISSTLGKVYNIITTALLSQETYKNVSSNVDNCKFVTDTNVLHQLDLNFRSLVHSQMRKVKLKESINKNKVKCVAQQLNDRRLQLMTEIKAGLRKLPPDLVNILQCANKTQENVDYINNYLFNLFAIDTDDA